MFYKKAVIIDDEPDICELLKYNLSKEGFDVTTFSTPLKALNYIENNTPDIILSDWLMPEMDGLELCRKLKMNNEMQNIPFVMITCKGDEVDIVTALELGADDYLVKPFKMKELISRIKKLIRNHEKLTIDIKEHSANSESKLNKTSLHKNISCGPITLNNDSYTAFIDHEQLPLTISEYRLLYTLMEKPDRIFSRSHLISILNGEEYLVTKRTIDVRIAGLRKKLGSYHYLIKTVRTIGYKFDESVLVTA